MTGHTRRLLARLANVFRHGAADRELSREVSAHLELLEDEFQRRGLTPDEARLAATRALGGVEQVRERHRDERALRWLDDAKRDVQYAVRTLGRAPGFTAVAILTLALGIGANTAIFSVVHALLLKPLPYKDSDRLVQLVVTVPAAQSPTGQPLTATGTISVAERFELQPRTKTLSHVGFCIPALRTLSGSEEATRVQGALVEPAVLRLLGVQPLLGRLFGAGEEYRDPAAVVILSALTWRRHFRGDPAIVGRTLKLDGKDYEIVGILPEGFAFPDQQTQFWIPVALQPVTGPAARGRAPMLARLADGVSIQAAAAEVDAILRHVEAGGWQYDLVRTQDTMVEPVKKLLLVLMGTVGVVLLIACVNVASLSLARTASRQREIAIRVALGAGRGRVIRHLLTESVLMTVLLVAGALLIHSFLKLSRVDPGYDATNVVTFQAALPEGYSFPRLKTFADEVVARLDAYPGVQAASYARQVPMVTDRQTVRFRRTPTYPEQTTPLPLPGEDARLVSQRYLEVMGIRAIAGRTFGEADRAGQTRALVINQALARRDFGGEDPIGKIAYVGRDGDPWQIVGVVNDVRQFGLDEPPEPQVFIDYRQWPGSRRADEPQYFAVRTYGDPAAVTSELRNIVRAVDSRAGIFNVDTLQNLVSNAVSRPRLYALLLGTFAAIAVVLAAVGIYGVLTYSVAERRREIGIRMALGARSADVLALVLGQTGILTLAGIVLGLAVAAGVTRYLDWMLFGLVPLDPMTFGAVAIAFAAIATLVPARRATRVDPLIALR